MIILVVPQLNANGMALWPVVLVRLPNPGPFLLNHERIHHRQQVELGVIPFYVFYLLEYVYRRWIEKRSHYGAYMALSFEREAYAHDRDLTYLKRRKLWAFWRYL